MGSKGGSSSEAQQARAEEQARQRRIRQGTAEINKTFDGYSYGENAVDPKNLVVGQTYYDASGNPIVYNGAGSGLSGSAAQRAGNAATLQGRINSSGGFGSFVNGMTGQVDSALSGQPGYDQLQQLGTALGLKPQTYYASKGTKSGFDDAFYNARQQSYLDYANPQLQDQYANAQKQLTFALARQGNLDSSARGEKTAELQKLYDINAQKIADDALGYKTSAKTGVEDARANLITTLNATGDANAAAQQAIARSSTLSQPAAFSPLSQVFADFTNALGVQAAQERAAAMSGGSYTPTYNAGLFGNTGRVTVSR